MASTQPDGTPPTAEYSGAASNEPTQELNGKTGPVTIDRNEHVNQQLLDLLQSALVSKRDEYVRWRKAIGIEDRWRSDIDVYFGRADPTDDLDFQPKWPMERREPVQANPNGQRSTVRINISAAKTDSAVARVQEILFPTDDKNWALSPESIEDYEELADDQRPVLDANGQQLGTVADAVAIELKGERKKCAAMTKKIDSALTECDYADHGREVIRWGGMVGTGIMKAPIVRLKTSSKVQVHPQTGQFARVTEEEEVPAAESIDPRNFFPDPDGGPFIKNHSLVFERRQVSSSQLRVLAKESNYMPDRIRLVLSQPPKQLYREALPGEERTSISGNILGTNYELWEAHGEIPRETLEIIMGQEIDPLMEFRSCTVIVNDIVIGAYMYQSNTNLPYRIFNWYPDAETIFGYGLPWKYRTQQRVMNAGWRAGMDNMGVSSGCQIVMLEDAVNGADGNNEIRNRKVWVVKDSDDVEKAFKVWDVPSKLDDIIKLIDKANDLGDKEANFPDIMQGIKGSAPDQVGSLIALLSNAEGFIRGVVKNYDDGVTKSMITGFYDWFMDNDPDDSIKGEMSVTARGADVLFTKSSRSMLLMLLAKMKDSPVFGPHIREREVLIELLKMGYLDTDLILYSQQEVAQHQRANPPQPPIQLQVAEARASADEKSDQAMLARQQMITEEAQARSAQQHEQKMKEYDMRLQISVAEIASRERMSINDVRAQLAGKVMDGSVAKQLQANDAAVKMSSANHTGLAPQTAHVE